MYRQFQNVVCEMSSFVDCQNFVVGQLLTTSIDAAHVDLKTILFNFVFYFQFNKMQMKVQNCLTVYSVYHNLNHNLLFNDLKQFFFFNLDSFKKSTNEIDERSKS